MELTIGNIYNKLNNLSYSSEDCFVGCNLIKADLVEKV